MTNTITDKRQAQALDGSCGGAREADGVRESGGGGRGARRGVPPTPWLSLGPRPRPGTLRIPGVGRVTEQLLGAFGVRVCGDIVKQMALLAAVMTPSLLDFALGEERRD